jgi:hypothetical protein
MMTDDMSPLPSLKLLLGIRSLNILSACAGHRRHRSRWRGCAHWRRPKTKALALGSDEEPAFGHDDIASPNA